MMMKLSSKRSNTGSVGMFDVLQALDSQDTNAERGHAKRRKLDIQRSKAAQSQTKIYSSLLECRILLQRSITTQQQQQDQEESPSNIEQNVDTAALNCSNLLANLLAARQMMRQATSADDIGEVDYHKLVQNNEEYSQQLDDALVSEYQSVREDWKEIFNRRHRDVRLHTGQLTAKSTQFRVMDSSFWEQVEATVQHDQQKQKLQRIKSQSDENDDNVDDSSNNNNWQAFDDTKVYQQLLKDFVTTASSQTGREEAVAAQERLLKKQQRKNGSSGKNIQVDRKASKGRKIRYTEIPKLLNFTFPLSRPNAFEHNGSALDEDEWFKSLFGEHSNNNKYK
jgi:protein AATF/BFR2